MDKINIQRIRTDGGTQSREKLDELVVGDYAVAIRANCVFPAIDLYFDGSDYWLADGFHRFFAFKQAGMSAIDANVHAGTRRDAWLHALGANATNGLHRSNKDKRYAVTLALKDKELNCWSDNQIARQCRVSPGLVSEMRVTIEIHSENSKGRTYRTKNGTVATMSTGAIGKKRTKDADAPKQEPPPVVQEYGVNGEQVQNNQEPPEDDSAPDDAEVRASELAIKAEAEYLEKLLAADDKMAFLHAENKRLISEIASLTVSRDGFMNESNEMKKIAKKAQRENERLRAK